MPDNNKTRLPDGQEVVMTIWKDGSYKIWGAVDALYAKDDPDYFVTIPFGDIMDEARKSEVRF